tara:strand:+ start:369 stop:1004 length:636 start_codon:yes stop_codon:yes gene_type:complete
MKTTQTSLYSEIEKTINRLEFKTISEERKLILEKLSNYIQSKTRKNEEVKIQFICTHNSRRSHLSQVWAQAIAHYFGMSNVTCYSGGTEATALFPKIIETLRASGFKIKMTSKGKNPVYEIKYSENDEGVTGFSKKIEDDSNPKKQFAAVMTCSEADNTCPNVEGAEKRISLTYDDPKAFDQSPLQTKKYNERSLQIAKELFYVFSKANSK